MIALTHTQSGAFYLYSTGLGAAQPTSRQGNGAIRRHRSAKCSPLQLQILTRVDATEM